MPVTLEQIHRPSGPDKDDLLKIYRDCDAGLLPAVAGCEPGTADWLERWLAQAGHWVAAGRFNDRLLGAALMGKESGHWHIHALCTRAVTRRRGVARRLLQLLQQQAATARCSLSVTVPRHNVAIPLLEQLGFTSATVADDIHVLHCRWNPGTAA